MCMALEVFLEINLVIFGVNQRNQILKNSLFIKKSTACRCQCSTVECLIEDKNSKSQKVHNS